MSLFGKPQAQVETKTTKQQIFEGIIAKRNEMLGNDNYYQGLVDEERLDKIPKEIPFEILAMDLGIPEKFVYYHDPMHDLFSIIKTLVAKTPEDDFQDFKEKVDPRNQFMAWSDMTISALEYESLLELIRQNSKLKSPEDIAQIIQQTNEEKKLCSVQAIYADPDEGCFYTQDILARSETDFMRNTTPHNIIKYSVANDVDDVNGVLYAQRYTQVFKNTDGTLEYENASLVSQNIRGEQTLTCVKNEDHRFLANVHQRCK